MTGMEVTMAAAATVFASFCLGWAACWLHHRITRGSPGDADAMAKLHEDLLIAERTIEQTRTEAEEEVARAAAESADSAQKYRELLDRYREAQDENHELRTRLEM